MHRQWLRLVSSPRFEVWQQLQRSCWAGLSSRALSSRAHAAQSAALPRNKVCVGLSGGVDSSVVALLGKCAGLDVEGVFMKNWDNADEIGSTCPIEEDWDSARRVADRIGIPISRVNLTKEYWNDVFEPFLDAYDGNYTPNPDVGCNRHVKFGAFMRHCLDKEGANFIATGHYARIQPNVALEPLREAADFSEWAGRTAEAMTDADLRAVFEQRQSPWIPKELLEGIKWPVDTSSTPSALYQGLDKSKDQSYFLAQVDPSAWKRVWMPLGAMRKADVRRIAAAAGLDTASRKDSVGICFIGKRRMGDFLPGYLPLRGGDFVAWGDAGPGGDSAGATPLADATNIDKSLVSGSAKQTTPPHLEGLQRAPTVRMRRLGRHRGAALYTEGQSAGIGGLAARAYVARKGVDAEASAAQCVGGPTAAPGLGDGSGWVPGSDVVVVSGRTHPLLYSTTVFLDTEKLVVQLPAGSSELAAFWEQLRSPGGALVAARFRNLQPLVRCCTARLVPAEGATVETRTRVRVDLPLPHRALSPGQVAVLHTERVPGPGAAVGGMAGQAVGGMAGEAMGGMAGQAVEGMAGEAVAADGAQGYGGDGMLCDYGLLPVLASARIEDTGPSMWHRGRRTPYPVQGQTSLQEAVRVSGSHPSVLGDSVGLGDAWVD